MIELRFLNKKGRLEWETLGSWLIWLAIAIIALLLIIAIKTASDCNLAANFKPKQENIQPITPPSIPE